MVRRRLSWICTLSASLCAFFCTVGQALAQEVPKAKPGPADAVKAAKKVIPREELRDPAKRKALIDKMIADYDLTPHPPVAIPDNPPPHEGAMISLPLVVEPPDLVIVEVLEALPGRPISGERLVRPDGMISLSFYGEVPVRGLSLAQMKVAIIKLLRKHLYDQALGLEVERVSAAEMEAPERPPVPGVPDGANPFDGIDESKPTKKTSRTIPSERNPLVANSVINSRQFGGRRVPVRPVAAGRRSQEPVAGPDTPKAPAQIHIPAGATGRITITIDVASPARAGVDPAPVDAKPEPAFPLVAASESIVVVPPEASDMVFVDVTAYNSRNYYVGGDVGTPGLMPWTGNETVLDALQYAAGLLYTADPKQITLVRPARGGKPARIYPVDLEAIQEKGQVATNYQIFPGDRLIVGRNAVVKKTVEIDRLIAPIQSITGMMLQEANMLRSLQLGDIDKRDTLFKEYVDFWTKALANPDGIKFDDQTLRDAFIRKMKLIPGPPPPQAAR
jgi:protein involved in polysaccharide export with SLBB domain